MSPTRRQRGDFLDPDAPMCRCGHTRASHAADLCFACAGPPCDMPRDLIPELVRVLDDAYPAQASDSLRHDTQMRFLALAIAEWLDSREEWKSSGDA